MNCPNCKKPLSFKQLMLAASVHGLKLWRFIDSIQNRNQPYRQTLQYKNMQAYQRIKENELKKNMKPHCSVCLTEKSPWEK